LGHYVVDFCSLEKRLIVELDGGQHALNQDEDAKRTQYLKKSGYKVICFWNNEVLENIEGVLERIKQSLA